MPRPMSFLRTKRARHAGSVAVTVLIVLSVTGCASGGKEVTEGQAFWNRVFSKETYRLYKPPITQGNNNILEKDKTRRLKIGMTRQQVLFLLGEPVMPSVFNLNRWDYLYYNIPPKGPRTSRKLSLFFENELLAKICRAGRCRPIRKAYGNRLNTRNPKKSRQ